MKKILLCCSSGMSTSLLVNKMRKVAEEHKVPVEINAVGLDRFESEIKEYDVALLGPQVRFKLEEFKSIAENFGKKVEFTVNMDGNYLSCSVLQTISLFDIIMVSLRFSLRKSRNVRRRSRPRFPRGMT